MSLQSYLNHWNCQLDHVPGKTGAASVMDLADLKPVFRALDVHMENEAVLDVGCGTGRLSQVCKDYYGVDISPSMVDYCLREGVPAQVITGPFDLVEMSAFDRIACLSVFTHIPRIERQEYLSVFSDLAVRLLVDILPGREGGGIGSWFADVGDFESDLVKYGWTIAGQYEQTSPDRALHRYYECSLR